METLFEELKRYVQWNADDEAVLRSLHPLASPEFERIADVFYRRILNHTEARKALEGGESQVGRLKVTLKGWMDSLLSGPWDESYYERRARIGRVHVRIALPQHYMFGAMNVLQQELSGIIDRHHKEKIADERVARAALSKILDLELAIMLHTYRDDLMAQHARHERLSTFGQLVGSIGHELRNPLGVIESSLYILKKRLIDGDDRVQKHVERIDEQLKISNQIISDLLDMIRDRPLEYERFHPSALLQSVLATLQISNGVRIRVNGFDLLPEINADRSKLRQVLVNLLQNAAHAVGESGTIHISVSIVDNHMLLAVQDSGPGINPAIRARLFEPLITTKTKGIGLGLSLVRRIVERHGGMVNYESPPGSGARFVIRLPMEEKLA